MDRYESQIAKMVEKYPDARWSEYCEFWGITYNNWVSISTMCRALQKQKLTQKKDITPPSAIEEKQKESKN